MKTYPLRQSKWDRLSDPEAHTRLKELYDARVTMTQQQFGLTYGIGTQGMVWQYLRGHTPLTLEAAAKFAKGLGCTIADISPMLASAVHQGIIPILGPVRKLKRITGSAGLPVLLCTITLPAILHNLFIWLNTHCVQTTQGEGWLGGYLDPCPSLATAS